MQHSAADIWHMRSALNLARTGLGRVWPNPSVGCVIVQEGIVIGRARTADTGRPHAETQALMQAGSGAKYSTAYITLEPCAHVGQTGSCAQALIDAGVKRLIIATLDPDKRVSGQGVQMLYDAGIDVVVGVLEQEARKLNKGYFLRKEVRRPLITLKTASTLDSKIATSTGESQWITGEKARSFAHIERAQHDAILVGVNTILTDNPSLTTRVNGADHDTVRVILDTNLKIKDDYQLFDNIEQNPVWIITSKQADEAQTLIDKGVQILTISKSADGQIDLHQAIKILAEKGLTRVLVEGGGKTVTSFLKEGLFDRLLWFHNASILGSDSYNAFQEMHVTHLNERIKLMHSNRRIFGEDMLDIYTKAQ